MVFELCNKKWDLMSLMRESNTLPSLRGELEFGVGNPRIVSCDFKKEAMLHI